MKKTEMKQADHRNYPRVEKLFIIAYVPQEGGPQRTPISLGRTVNISPSGVAMQVYRELAVGTRIELEIDLEDSTASAYGEVVRIEDLGNGDYLAGIKFDPGQDLVTEKIVTALVADH